MTELKGGIQLLTIILAIIIAGIGVYTHTVQEDTAEATYYMAVAAVSLLLAKL